MKIRRINNKVKHYFFTIKPISGVGTGGTDGIVATALTLSKCGIKTKETKASANSKFGGMGKGNGGTTPATIGVLVGKKPNIGK